MGFIGLYASEMFQILVLDQKVMLQRNDTPIFCVHITKSVSRVKLHVSHLRNQPHLADYHSSIIQGGSKAPAATWVCTEFQKGVIFLEREVT